MMAWGERPGAGFKVGFWLTACLVAWPALRPSGPQTTELSTKSETVSTQPDGGELVWRRLTEYSIQARVPVLGDIGHVGTFAIEEEVRRNGEATEKVFRVFGASKPELARKGKDYKGEIRIVRAASSGGAGGAVRPAAAGPEMQSSGYFNKNGAIEAESITFYPGYAVSRRESGDEKKVDGSCGCLVSAFAHFLENDVKEGDVYQSRFVFGGHPFVFKCEVGRPVCIQPSGAKVFPIDFTTRDGVEKDSTGRFKVVKKKGAIRLWLSKEEPYKNTYLRLMIQYRWYLTLHMEMIRST